MIQDRVTYIHNARRVIVGDDETGLSTVVDDSRSLPAVDLPNGIRIQEIWQQNTIPAHPTSDARSLAGLGPDAPLDGAAVRILTIPVNTEARHTAPDLHADEALHVFTMLHGELTVILERGTVRLDAGDSAVFRANLHDLRNEGDEDAVVVYTSVPLVR